MIHASPDRLVEDCRWNKITLCYPFHDYAAQACDCIFEDGRDTTTLSITTGGPDADAADVCWRRS
jgi:hypothetical protein